MIKNLFVTGDVHGDLTKFKEFNQGQYDPKETAIIVLGDTGCNFYIHSEWKDYASKKKMRALGYTFYLLRGNHDYRPEHLEDIKKIYDDYAHGYIYMEDKFPTIKYLIDGEIYEFNGHKCLAIGGAYSVDKEFRIANNWPWFEDEQLNFKEMCDIDDKIVNKKFDFVFTHTCPVNWMPRDLFLSQVSNSSVDYTMENWLGSVENHIDWKVWLFGHYHADRMERPYVELLFNDIVLLEDIWYRWDCYSKGDKSTIWYGEKSPNFYF